jgi:hypothetical protein
MSKIVEWLHDFLMRLRDSFPPVDWPPVGSEAYDVFYKDFHSAFARNGVSEAEAEEARSLLAENPPRFKQDYIPKVVGAVKVYRELSPATDGLDGAAGPMDDREAALRASKACIRCFGDGLAIVYASRPSDVRRIPATTAAYCVCPYGQWVERTHREKSNDVWTRIPHLSNVLAGRSFWRLDPPGYEGLSENNRPATGAGDLIRSWTATIASVPRAAASAPPRRPDLGRVEPSVPLPPRPAPVPEPAPEIETTEEALDWI